MKAKQIVVIMTDTQRADMVGCYGNKDMKTPSLDKLAAEGIQFLDAHTCQPVCGPARAAIFTGTYPHSNGSWGNSMAIGDNVKTLGQRFRDNGFQTGYIGKWHLDGSDYFGNGICPDGWEEKYWYDMRTYLEELTDEDRLQSRNPKIMKTREITEEFTYGHRCSNRAIDFLREHKDEEFFLVVSYDEPHHPFVCPEPYSSMYDDYCFPKCENIWDTLEDKPLQHKLWAAKTINEDKDALIIKDSYLFSCNSYVDYEIGRVLTAIDEYASDALIVYTADHGDMLSSHSLYSKGPAMYEEITKIPFIVKCKGQIEPEQVYKTPVSHIDIAPTVLNAAGIPISRVLEGKSLVPALLNVKTKINDQIFMEFDRYEIDHDGFGGFQPIRSVYDGRYKLVINLNTTDELYDLSVDPYEMKNLINQEDYIEIRDNLHDALLDWMDETRDPFRGYCWEFRSWRKPKNPLSYECHLMTRQRINDEYEPRQLDYATGLPITKATRVKGV